MNKLTSLRAFFFNDFGNTSFTPLVVKFWVFVLKVLNCKDGNLPAAFFSLVVPRKTFTNLYLIYHDQFGFKETGWLFAQYVVLINKTLFHQIICLTCFININRDPPQSEYFLNTLCQQSRPFFIILFAQCVVMIPELRTF